MKKYFEGENMFEALRGAVNELQERQDKKTQYIFIGVTVALLALAVIGVLWLIKNKMEDDLIDEWDEEEWEDDEDCCCDDEEGCCCSDNDVDKDIKVESF